MAWLARLAPFVGYPTGNVPNGTSFVAAGEDRDR